MDSHERVSAALDRKPMDHVPMRFNARTEVIAALKAHLRIDSTEDLLKRLAIDFRYVTAEDVERMLFMGSGVLITAVLTYLKYRFVHLPLHPVALMLQGTYMARKTVFSVFVTWMYKATVLKFGGVQLYRKGQPFFIGLLIGYAFGTFLACVVDGVFFFGQGHLVHGF